MAYTNPNATESYTPTGNISGELIAHQNYMDDPYARFLYLANGVSATDLTIISAGTAFVKKDGVLKDCTMGYGGGIYLSAGGAVLNASGVNARIYMYGGRLEGGRLEGGTYFINFSGGVISGLHIAAGRKINLGGGDTYDLVVSGGYQTVSGGAAYRTTVLNGGSMILAANGNRLSSTSPPGPARRSPSTPRTSPWAGRIPTSPRARSAPTRPPIPRTACSRTSASRAP